MRFNPAAVSFFVGLVAMALKVVAWRLTGSVAYLSDALESVINLTAAVAVFFTRRLALKPPDKDHPWGHAKAEYFSAVVEGGLIIFAAAAIIQTAWGNLWTPHPLESLALGSWVYGASVAVNGALAVGLILWSRKRQSPALTAHGHHIAADVLTSLGVFIGVGLAKLTGLWVLDPAVAILVALWIVVSGFSAIRDSVRGLMDTALPDDELSRLHGLVAAGLVGTGAIEAHAFRTRRAGAFVFIEFHLVVPDEMPVGRAHGVCDLLEVAVGRAFPGASVTIHVEPEHEALDQTATRPETSAGLHGHEIIGDRVLPAPATPLGA